MIPRETATQEKDRPHRFRETADAGIATEGACEVCGGTSEDTRHELFNQFTPSRAEVASQSGMPREFGS